MSPSLLSFTATEGGTNPPSQTMTVVKLSATFQHYSIVPNASWASIAAVNPLGVYPVSVDISGMTAGTFKTTIDVTDTDAPSNHQSVAVILKILSNHNAGGDISGSWEGTWTLPAQFSFGGNVCVNLSSVINESGNMTMNISTHSGGLPGVLNLTGSVVSMSGLQAASVPCGGGTTCTCSMASFNVTPAAFNSMSMWSNVINQVLIFADVTLPPSGPPDYLAYPLSSLTFSGTYANGKINGTFNSTGTFSVTKQ